MTTEDQEASSFGDPNAQPPTPKQTPSSSVFRSPAVFETPKQNQGRFEEPQFAEDYSVFNATPGNLAGSRTSFYDYVPVTPVPPSAGKKQLQSADREVIGTATHANSLPPNSEIAPIGPADFSRQQLSSPNPLTYTLNGPAPTAPAKAQKRPAKKARLSTAVKDPTGQTATPPPSSNKSGRKLAPKLRIDSMQHGPGFVQQDFNSATQPHNLDSFNSAGTRDDDPFGFPMSAPATAPAYTGPAESFWGPEIDASGMSMDMSFHPGGMDMFQTSPQSHQPMNPLDWSGTIQTFQGANLMSQQVSQQQSQQHQHQQQQQHSKRDRQLAPKSQAPQVEAPFQPDFFGNTFQPPIDGQFTGAGIGAGVDPGLLYTQPPSMVLTATAVDPPSQLSEQPSSSAPAAPQTTDGGSDDAFPKAPMGGAIRRPASVTNPIRRNQVGRPPVTSPIKSAGHPGLSRSLSDNRGRRPVKRRVLPALAPAQPVVQQPRPQAVMHDQPPPQVSHPERRSSPLKSHHRRPSSLTTINENASSVVKAPVIFRIDKQGRAHADSVVDMADEREASASSGTKSFSSDLDSSSSDDEEIIIPSRNASFSASFSMPDVRGSEKRQRASTFSRLGHAGRHNSSRGSRGDLSQSDNDSDAETIVDGQPRTNGLGDAASELQKVIMGGRPVSRLNGQQRGGGRKTQLPGSGTSSGHRQRFLPSNGNHVGSSSSRHDHSTESPSTMTHGSVPTLSTVRSQKVRCICNRPDADMTGDSFMVKCDYCEHLLHSRCIKMTKRDAHSIYVCAFCVGTPNKHDGLVKDHQSPRARGIMGPPLLSSSPLAQRSMRAFR